MSKKYTIPEKPIREWESGGKRDTEEGKLDFEGFLSPLVIKRYGKYMDKHRKMRDGSIRDSDNWQKGFGDDHFKVCMKSLWRHFLDIWSCHRSSARTNGISYREQMEESLCALIFNAMAYLHRILERDEYSSMSDYINDLKSVPGSKIGEMD